MGGDRLGAANGTLRRNGVALSADEGPVEGWVGPGDFDLVVPDRSIALWPYRPGPVAPYLMRRYLLFDESAVIGEPWRVFLSSGSPRTLE